MKQNHFSYINFTATQGPTGHAHDDRSILLKLRRRRLITRLGCMLSEKKIKQSSKTKHYLNIKQVVFN